MKIAMELRRTEFEIDSKEAHVVETEGDRLIMVKLPLPSGLNPTEAMDYVQKQAVLIREFLKDDPMILVVPTRPGDTCELGVVSPSLEDLKECIRALPTIQRNQLIQELKEGS
jgi:hypothetical protein